MGNGAMAHRIGEIFSYLAANKKVYHVVDSEELSLVSGTEHHGGICMLVKKQRTFFFARLFRCTASRKTT